MKIATPDEMRRLEQQAYQSGCSEEEFMETAGKNCANAIEQYVLSHGLPKLITLLIGKGNNGGDAYVAGRYLHQKGFCVSAWQPIEVSQCSSLLQLNAQRFLSCGGKISSNAELAGVLVDGIFGTGFKGPPREPFLTMIQSANHSNSPILAIDIPSGLNGETGEVEGEAIKAAQTIFLQLPKQGFFLNSGWEHVGELVYAEFGLPQQIVDDFPNQSEYLLQAEVSTLLPKLSRSRHKYQAGYAVGWAGSPGMAGAAILCSNAIMKSGAGITRLYHPEGMEGEFAQALPEVILRTFDPSAFPQEMVDQWKRATSLYIGPGIGVAEHSRRIFKELLPRVTLPILLDADALTLLADLQLTPPKNALLTPHLGELKRLLYAAELLKPDLKLWEACQHYVEQHRVTLVVKGAPTYIFHSGQPIAVMARGDPGMATAGSGDVLSGLLAGLLAQQVAPYDAAKLGTYLHALAGEIAAKRESSYCMTASSILEAFPEAFKTLIQLQQIVA